MYECVCVCVGGGGGVAEPEKLFVALFYILFRHTRVSALTIVVPLWTLLNIILQSHESIGDSVCVSY